jgi:hypothetical protein
MTTGPLASRRLSAFSNGAQGTGAGIPHPGLIIDDHITRTGWFEGL